jgi:hypothetical protein
LDGKRRPKITKKLEELFQFDQLEPTEQSDTPPLTVEQTRAAIVAIDTNIDKIDSALPAVRDLDASDRELDELADLAKQSYQDLSDLGMQVESRFAAELFAVAGTMLGHALTAKTTKLNKKLKIIDLQLKKLKMDQQTPKDEQLPTAEGQILSRNDLLERLIGSRDQKDKSS